MRLTVLLILRILTWGERRGLLSALPGAWDVAAWLPSAPIRIPWCWWPSL